MSLRSCSNSFVDTQGLNRLWGDWLWGEVSCFINIISYKLYMHTHIHIFVHMNTQLYHDAAASRETDTFQWTRLTFNYSILFLKLVSCWRDMYLRLHMIHPAKEMCICDPQSKFTIYFDSDNSLFLILVTIHLHSRMPRDSAPAMTEVIDDHQMAVDDQLPINGISAPVLQVVHKVKIDCDQVFNIFKNCDKRWDPFPESTWNWSEH